MNTLTSRQNFDLKEISFSELSTIKGGNTVAFAALCIAGLKFVMEASYNVGYAVGYYVAKYE